MDRRTLERWGQRLMERLQMYYAVIDTRTGLHVYVGTDQLKTAQALEVGTCFGISTSYKAAVMAAEQQRARVNARRAVNPESPTN